MADKLPKAARDWLKAIGAKGGASRSPAKILAARRNGKKRAKSKPHA